MRIIISEIPEEGMELELNEDIQSGAVKIISPVHASLKIDKKESEVFVSGIISGDVELQCSRCLRNFIMKIESSQGVVYNPTATINKEEHYELKSDELDTGFYKEDFLEINELLAEQFLLNIPMKPLCSPECKGICPKCGTDLNMESCGCKFSEVDPRLKVLEQLLKRKE